MSGVDPDHRHCAIRADDVGGASGGTDGPAPSRAFAGLVAGGISAVAYALHCTDDSLPFVALWYGGTIVVCTLAGAALGPRLLRW